VTATNEPRGRDEIVPSHAPEPISIPGDRDGDGKLSEFEKQLLARHAPKDYTMPDGSVVQLDPAQPLPELVKAVVIEQARPPAQALSAANDIPANDAATLEMFAFVDAKAEELGRPVVLVFEDHGQWGSLASGVHVTGLAADTDLSVMVDKVQGWANGRYEVIVVE